MCYCVVTGHDMPVFLLRGLYQGEPMEMEAEAEAEEQEEETEVTAN